MLLQTLRGIDADLMVNDVMSFGMFVALKLGVRNVDLDVGTAGSLWEPVLCELAAREHGSSGSSSRGRAPITTLSRCCMRADGSESSGTFLPAVGTFLPTNGMNLLQRAANVAASKLSEAGLKWAIWGKHGWVADIVARHNVPLKRPYNNYMLLLTNRCDGVALQGRGMQNLACNALRAQTHATAHQLRACAPLLPNHASHFVLEAPRALAPNTKYIGPMLPSPPKPLPPGLASWMDGCPDPGCVYVSFGGMLQAPLAASRTLAAAMAAMPGVRFVWSLSLEQQVALSEQLASLANVHIAEWVPQNDLLGHPRTAAFVTQGGYLSMAEAAWHAVPVLGLPFIPGQGEIIQYAQDSGRALRIRGDTLAAGRADEFGAALRALLSNRSYADAAAVAAARIRATPRPYAQQAAEWVEYAAALRQHGPFLNPQKLHLTWWQQAALDVVGLYAALAAMPAAALCWCVSGAVRRWRYSRAGARPAAVRATITLLGAKKEA